MNKAQAEKKKKFAIKVGKNIRKYREAKGYSQEDLADMCGLYRTYVGHLENGRYSPSGYILWEISRALRINISDLFLF